MGNKKGFVLIETIVAITVLSVSLLYIYSSFNSVLIKERARVNYDDVAYIYRTHYVKDFFKQYELNYVLSLLKYDKTKDDNNPIIIIGCDYEGIFNEDEDAKNLCNKLTEELGIKNIAVSLSDLSYISGCNESNTNYECLYLNNFSLEEEAYLRSLGKLATAGRYVMLIEYEEKVDEREIDDSGNIEFVYEHNYAWVEI